MTLLDGNVPEVQRLELRRLGVALRQAGFEWGRKGMTDEGILAALRQMKRVTILTTDADFYRRENCHASYCLVWLAVPEEGIAVYARRFMRHAAFRTFASRQGKVVRVEATGMGYGERNSTRGSEAAWS